MDFSSTQYWLMAAFVLGVLEIFTGTFVLLFFALSSVLVATVTTFGVESLALQLLLFAGFAAAGILIFRAKIRAALSHKGAGFSIDQKQIFTASETIPAHGQNHIHYQGSLWNAQNSSDQEIKKGEMLEIIRAEGNRLIVRPHS
jgi:membrane protein implicated in regulation of membrane protease activity